MSETGAQTYAAFLGTWILDPKSCDYEQETPPQSGRYHIEDRDGRIHFTVDWTDETGGTHRVEFSGVPDGRKEPFAGGELADALSVEAVSPRELNSSAYFGDERLMIAQRQLDERGLVMRVTQQVRLPDGSRPTNVSIYHKHLPN